jgi:hypothetical protein
MVQAETIQKLLESGSSVDISDLDLNVHAITNLVEVAVAKGSVLTVGKGYTVQAYEQWAQIGGRSVAFRF